MQHPVGASKKKGFNIEDLVGSKQSTDEAAPKEQSSGFQPIQKTLKPPHMAEQLASNSSASFHPLFPWYLRGNTNSFDMNPIYNMSPWSQGPPSVGPMSGPLQPPTPSGWNPYLLAAAAAQRSDPASLAWIRQRYFPGRIPGTIPYDIVSTGCDAASVLLQSFRKPKRIRTAFSPSQLLKLENAFEKNHYVVGQERKQLAQALNLTETQVKVWFQNRRTKYKRIKSEEDVPGGNGSTSGGKADEHHHGWNEGEGSPVNGFVASSLSESSSVQSDSGNEDDVNNNGKFIS